MDKRRLNIFASILALSGIIFIITAAVILFRNSAILLGSLLLLSLLFILGALFITNKRRQVKQNRICKKLFSLTASLRLSEEQTSESVHRDIDSVSDIENALRMLEETITIKTDEQQKKADEIKNKTHEIVKQNKELVSAYDALKESRDRYEKLVKNLEGEYFFYGVDVNYNIIYVSPSVHKILGYTVSEYKANWRNIYTNNPINETARTHFMGLLKGIKQPRYFVEVTAKDCSLRILEILEIPVLSPTGEIISLEGQAHDVTERYFAEGLIREQEEKYRRVFNSASDFIYINYIKKDGSSGSFIEANKYTQQMLGYSSDELVNMTPDDLVAAEIWTEDYERGKREKYERIWESKDGRIFYVEISEHTFTIKGKKASISVARDITDRKKALDEIKFMNEELINQKENLEALLDNLTQTQEQLVQSEKMAALGQLIAGVAHEINTPLGAIKASIGNLGDSLNSALTELPDLLNSQVKENIDLFKMTFDLSKNIKQNLSTREKREKKRAIRKKLVEENIESADLIADVLAYMEIFEGVPALLPFLKSSDSLKTLYNVRNFISLLKNTKTISIASDKASKVVFALKKYAHRDTIGEKVPTDIIDGIETVLTLYDNQLKQGVEVVKSFMNIPLVMCYQDEINQVWTNLITNAIQAMNQNGTLTIVVNSDEKNIFVSISDTGEGIEPDILKKIFDPFFTTKKQGEGSGLGLDIVKKIIDKHGGDIHVQSTLGEGTTFTIQIPLV